MKLTKRLEALEGKVTEARTAEREVRLAAQRAAAEFKGGREALADLLSQDNPDPAQERALHAKLAKIKTNADRDWEVPIAAAQRKLRRVEMERDRFVVDNVADLVGEQVPSAIRAAEALEAQVAGIDDAVRAYNAVQQRLAMLLRPVQGVDGGDIVMANVDSLRMECQRVLDQGIPAPLPRQFTEQEDPTIRSAA